MIKRGVGKKGIFARIGVIALVLASLVAFPVTTPANAAETVDDFDLRTGYLQNQNLIGSSWGGDGWVGVFTNVTIHGVEYSNAWADRPRSGYPLNRAVAQYPAPGTTGPLLLADTCANITQTGDPNSPSVNKRNLVISTRYYQSNDLSRCLKFEAVEVESGIMTLRVAEGNFVGFYLGDADGGGL